MTTFILRFQLSNGTLTNYKILKSYLLKVGFSKEITASDNTKYVLPQGQYIAISERPKEEILEIAKKQAFKIDRRCQILVVESVKKGCTWVNLPLA